MLLPDNIHPENSIYYNGAIVLNVLQESTDLELVSIYQKVKRTKNLSFPVFLLCLDWLYIINVAEVKNGRIELCS